MLKACGIDTSRRSIDWMQDNALLALISHCSEYATLLAIGSNKYLSVFRTFFGIKEKP